MGECVLSRKRHPWNIKRTAGIILVRKGLLVILPHVTWRSIDLNSRRSPFLSFALSNPPSKENEDIWMSTPALYEILASKSPILKIREVKFSVKRFLLL